MCAVYCFVASDLKALIAYSSVVHMAAGVWLVFCGFVRRWRGVLVLMLLHGVISAGLFI